MKSVLKWVMLLSIVLTVGGVTLAQDPAERFCGALSEADCTLIEESQSVMQNLESSSFKLNVDVNVSGIPDMPVDPLQFKLTGTGSTVVDRKAMPDKSSLNPQDMATDPTRIFKFLADVIPSLGADVHFSLTLPKEVVAMLAKETKLPETLRLSFKLVEGVAYVNAEELAAYVPQLKGAAGWMGINIVELINAMMKQPQFSAGMSGMAGSTMGMNFSSDMVKLFSDPKVLGKFVKIERLEDGVIDGKAVAIFATSLDYEALFSMPEMKDLIVAQQAAMGSKLSDRELEMVMAMLTQMGKNMHFDMQQSIDLESKYAHQIEMSMTFDMTSMASGTANGKGPVFDMKASIAQGDFNAVKPLTAPDGALVLPIQSFMPSK